MNESHAIADEKYEFKSATRSKLIIAFVVGLVLFIAGVFMAKSGGHEEEGAGEGKKEHASANISKNLVASTSQEAHAEAEHKEGGEHEGTAPWLKRIYTSL